MPRAASVPELFTSQCHPNRFSGEEPAVPDQKADSSDLTVLGMTVVDEM